MIITQCIHVSKHHVVPYKYVQLFCVNKNICVHSRKMNNRCEKEALRQARVLACIFKEIKGKGILMKLQIWTLRKKERVCQKSAECIDSILLCREQMGCPLASSGFNIRIVRA